MTATPIPSTRTPWTLLFAGILLFSGIVLFYRLGIEPFQDYDEATYAEVTAESLAHGNYLSLTFLNNPYFRKPPLLFWVTAAGEKVFPDVEFAMRFPSALAAFLLIALVFLVCLEAGAGLGGAALASIILATTSAAMEPARQARFDVLISLFIMASLYAGMRAQRSPKWYLLMGVFVACAILTKSVIAVFAAIALLLYIYQQKRRAFLKEGWFWGGVATFLAVAAPWHIYEWLVYGADFWRVYIGTQVIDRASINLLQGISSDLTTNADYVRHFFTFGAPWSEGFILSVLGSLFFVRMMPKNVRSLWITSVGTVIAIAGVMLWSHTKAVTYLIPLYPFMSIALALSIRGLWTRLGENGKVVLIGTVGTLAVLAAYLTVWNTFHLNPYYRVPYQLARDEYALSQAITERSTDPLIYTYKNDFLGSIQYYTRLPFATHPFVYLLSSATSTPPAFVVTPVALTELQSDFPQFTFAPLYTGSLLSAFTVAR
jgi:4-amino-4-deoxy-L-arabinose transferase-like glycosyltransferase